MTEPTAPFELDGASIYPEERTLLTSLIGIIYKVDPNREKNGILRHAQQTFRQIMKVDGGRWIRRKVFKIGNGNDGLSVIPSENPEYP